MLMGTYSSGLRAVFKRFLEKNKKALQSEGPLFTAKTAYQILICEAAGL